MQLSGNTILITGGTSGIGFELASELLKRGNTIIVTGRDQKRLDDTAAKLPGVHIYKSDVSDARDIAVLYAQLTDKFPKLNILVNNAGIMRKLNLQDSQLPDITREIDINLNGPLRMVQQFLPHLKKQQSAAIINVSSGLAFVPLALSPVYSATKAALHSYTQSLRLQLQHSRVKIIELAPPGTETPLFRGDFTPEDLDGMKGMDVKVLVAKALQGLENDRLEIRPGLSNVLKILSRVAPNFAARMLGKSAVAMGAAS
ncbi:MAG: SDR family NAD(P)-dependent oxidoreductase [Micavibrio sp.]|nr:SDR family NAD(P)-dependent oxidoreductase [Micavibrio sp.]